MIIVNLKGGLGNQMFQYALGRALSLKNNDILKLDTQSLSNAKELGNIYRPFDLAAFSIYQDIATPEEVKRLRYPNGILSKIKELFVQKIVRPNTVIFNNKILNLTGNQYLDGYWQSPRYFDQIKNILLEDFTLRKLLSASGEILKKEILNTNAISLHVRRGDYVANPKVKRENGICSPEYYKSAVALIKKEVASPHFFIFSDDITWVKENLSITDPVRYVEDTNLTAPEELYLMSICQHNIIANSSFSWWGAWLNQNSNKIVVAPTPWFDKIKSDKSLIPNSWKLLPK